MRLSRRPERAATPVVTEIVEIERSACRALPARERTWREGWLLQASDGVTGRMNSVTCFGVVPADVPATVRSVEEWYRARGLPPMFRLTEADPGVDRLLPDSGYGPREREVEVMTRPLDRPADLPSGVVGVDLDEWCRAFRICADDPPSRIAELCDAFTRVSEPRVHLVRYAEDEPVAVGAVVVTGRLAGIFDVAVHPAHRRRGHGRAITVGLASAAARRGATSTYLQVSADNHPARALYRNLGFAGRYRYWYRTLIPATGGDGP